MIATKPLSVIRVATLTLLALVFFPALAEAAGPVELKPLVEKEPNAAPKTKRFIIDKLLPHCLNPVFQKGVAAQNAKGITLAEIQKIDKAWQATEDELPIQTELTQNPVAVEIKKIVSANPAIAEAFVMDNQGANVGQNTLTSDYWQGDEDKWQKSFKGGKGGVHVGKAKFDRSANVVIQQISLPVFDPAGKVIGAVCWGVMSEKL